MIVAMVVDSRPRTCPSASITNQRGSMSPFLGKYVRMTLLKLQNGIGCPTSVTQKTTDLSCGKGGNGNTAGKRQAKAGIPGDLLRGGALEGDELDCLLAGVHRHLRPARSRPTDPVLAGGKMDEAEDCRIAPIRPEKSNHRRRHLACA